MHQAANHSTVTFMSLPGKLKYLICTYFSSVTQSRLTLCDPMDCSIPGFPVLHYLPEFAQTHVHWVNDTIQLPCLLSSPSLSLNLSSIKIFSNELALHIRWPKFWSFSFGISPSNEFSRLISFRIDWFDLLAVKGTCKSLLQHHSSKASFFGTQPSFWSNSKFTGDTCNNIILWAVNS